jgi:hypothetical protein
MTTNPWLSVPLSDYETHMRSEGVAQLEPLADLFSEVLARRQPSSVAILGVAGGNGLDRIDTAVTPRVLGVDIQPEYLDAVRVRFPHLAGLELIQADLSVDTVTVSPVQLVHAALVFEHAGTTKCLENAVGLVAEGGSLSVVLQLPSELDHAVGSSQVATVSKFADHFKFVEPEQFSGMVCSRGFHRTHSRTLPVASGKSFWLGVFDSVTG